MTNLIILVNKMSKSRIRLIYCGLFFFIMTFSRFTIEAATVGLGHNFERWFTGTVELRRDFDVVRDIAFKEMLFVRGVLNL